MKITITSYRPTEFKRGYLRVNGEFVSESSRTKKHRFFQAEIQPGDEIDARGSIFMGGDGRSKWNAPRGQWARIEVAENGAIAQNFDREEISFPDWVRIEN